MVGNYKGIGQHGSIYARQCSLAAPNGVCQQGVSDKTWRCLQKGSLLQLEMRTQLYYNTMDFVSKLPVELLSMVFHYIGSHRYDMQKQTDPYQCWCRVNTAFRDVGRKETFRHPTMGIPDLHSLVLDYIQTPHRRITTMSLRIVPEG